MRWSRRSRNWTSFSSPWARAWDGHDVVDLAVGRLFHSEFDSDAPFAWSQRLSQAMGMRHIVRYQGGGHGVIDREQPCIADTVDAYLFDLRLPQENLACPAEVTPGATEAVARGLARPSEGALRLSTKRR